jgi:hypothetical protein
VDDRQLIMAMRLLHVTKIAFETLFAFKALNLSLHGGNICRHFESRVIMEMNRVVGLAFYKVDAFVLERGAQVMKCFVEKPRK